jgi:hypothetical protein
MRRKIALFLLCLTLLIGAVGNYNTISNPQLKLTTYYRTHPYSYDVTPNMETDVPATAVRLVGINISVALVGAVLCLAGGVFANHKDKATLIEQPGSMLLSLKPTIDAIQTTIKTGRQEAIDAAIQRLKDLFERFEGTSGDGGYDRAKRDQEAKPVWQQHIERTAAAFSKVTGDVRSSLVKGLVDEFAQRFQVNLKELVEQNLRQAESPAPKLPMSPKANMQEIYYGDPEYREAWDDTKNYIDAKYADHPDILAAYHDVLNQALRIPVKLLDKTLTESLRASQVKISDVVKQWAGSQEMVKQKLIDDLKARIGLTPEQAKALGDAISTRFVERLQAARKDAVAKILRQSGKPRIANDAPALSKKIFEALNLGMAEHEAVWSAVVDSIS